MSKHAANGGERQNCVSRFGEHAVQKETVPMTYKVFKCVPNSQLLSWWSCLAR